MSMQEEKIEQLKKNPLSANLVSQCLILFFHPDFFSFSRSTTMGYCSTILNIGNVKVPIGKLFVALILTMHGSSSTSPLDFIRRICLKS
jgi:hypothetical protein